MTKRITANRFALLGAALLTGAASPTKYAPLAFVEPLAPQADAAAPQVASSGFAPAPVPDQDLDDSSTNRAQPARVEVTPSLFHQRATYHGEGYTPNSSVEGEQNRKIRPTPGFNLSVPLQ